MPAQIVIVGDHDPAIHTHRAIDDALGHVRALREHAIEWRWTNTTALGAAPEPSLSGADAIWLAPGSPYASLDGALNAVRIARQRDIPFLGVCGGFQHAILEIARDVAGIRDAAHAEIDASAPDPVIHPLACALHGKSGVIFLDAMSRMATIYGRWRIVEGYHCTYGVNPAYRDALERAGVRFVGQDAKGDLRAIELASHPFFLATLFQPQLASTPATPAPLVRAFVDAAIMYRAQRGGRVTPVAGTARP